MMEAEEKKVTTEHLHKEMPSVGQLFQESWIVFRKSLLNLFLLNLIYWAVAVGIAIVTVILVIVFGVSATVGGHGSESAIDPSFLPVLIIGGVVYAVAVLGVVLCFNGLVQIGSIIAIDQYKERVSVGEILQKSWKLLLPMLVVSVLSFFMVVGGFFLFLIPGFLFSWYLAFAANEMVLGHERGIHALRASAYTVMKNFWELALRALPIVGIYFAINMVSSFVPLIAMAIDEEVGMIIQMIFNVLFIIPSILLQWYFMVYGIVVYKHAKARTGEKKYASLLWVSIVSGIGWIIGILLISLLIFAITSGVFKKAFDGGNTYREGGYYNTNTNTQPTYDSYASNQITAYETFLSLNTYRAQSNVPTLEEDAMLCAYAQRRLGQLTSGYDNGEGFYDDRANVTIVGSYFNDHIKVGEAYYDLTIPATAEDIVYFWADDGDIRRPVNMKNYDAGCIRANEESMILIVGESK